MKTIYTLLALFTIHFSLFTIHSSAQVLCIKCYNQNARVLTDTNNLIVNGGFENTTCPATTLAHDSSFCPNSTWYHCDITNWICTGGGIYTYAHICDTSFSKIVEGTKAVYFGNSVGYICSTNWSDTACINKIDCEITGFPIGYPTSKSGYGGDTGVSLSQTVNGLTTGGIYILEFWSGGEKKTCNCYNYGMFAINLGFGNIFLTDPMTWPDSGIGTRYVIVFAADSSSHTIKFTNWGHIGLSGNGTELILDDVRLFAATEGNNICGNGINDLPQNTIATIFPNPATNLLTITTTSTQPSTIILFDIASRKLMEEKFSGTATLSIEGLAKGVYLYQVRDEKGVVSRGKVVKE